MSQVFFAWFVRALLMVAGTGLFTALLRIRSAALLHRIWTAVVLAMLLLPLWTAWGPSVTAHVLPAQPTLTTAHDLALVPATPEPRDFVPTDRPLTDPFVRPKLPVWPSRFFTIWLVGFAIMLIRLLRGTLQARSILREAALINGRLTTSRCAAPVTTGWLRPVALLPEDWPAWPAARLQAVLIHEDEHVRRRDPLVQWLALLNRAVFWFHPIAWWLDRKLTALAEEACDAAVLARGHAPADYARHLIDLARSVSESGARMRLANAVGFSGNHLRRRIARIVEASATPATPTAKTAALSGLCLFVLGASLACNVGRKTAPAQARMSMSERTSLERSRALERQEQGREKAALLDDAVLGMTPARARTREAELRNHPADEMTALELVRYYQSANDLKSLNALTQWFIAEHPDVRANWGERPAWDYVWDNEGFAQGRAAWLDQLNKPGHNEYFYMNAGEYLSGSDNELAEKMFNDGRRQFPNAALHWEVFLAGHYAWALAGTAGPAPDGHGISIGLNTPLSDSPYARKVRETLLASNDIELLVRTVEALSGNVPSAAFSQTLVDRILTLDPGNRQAHLQRERIRMHSVLAQARANPGSLNDSDRILALISRVSRRLPQNAETDASNLLSLAQKNPKDPNYGTAIFVANLVLGDASLKQGDKPGALAHLHAAEQVQPTEFLRYNPIDMSLPRGLVEVGERDSVASFLDHCAKFNQGGKPLNQWAALIRKGKNPPLSPDIDLFRNR